MARARALILAGGTESEALWPGPVTGARHLLQVADQPLLLHGLLSLRAAGVEEASLLVSPHTAEPTRLALQGRATLPLTPSVVELPGPLDHPRALLVAAAHDADPAAAELPLLVQPGDLLARDPIGPVIDDFIGQGLDALALVEDVSHAHPEGVAPLRPPQPGFVRSAGARGALELSGVFLLAPAALEELEASLERTPENESLEGALDRLSRAGGRVGVRTVRSPWRYSGRPRSLLEANRLVLDGLVSDWEGGEISNSQIHGRVVVHPTARVTATTVRGPVVIGPGACVDDSYIGPYTAIGAGVVIEGAEVEHSIILEGSAIRHVGRRLEGCLIGRDVRVGRGFDLPRALRLSVGDRAEISLA